MARGKKDENWSMKLVKPNEILQYFNQYKEEVKSNPILVHDFKWKDADSVMIKKEKPLTMEWFIDFIEEKTWHDIEHYFYPAESQKESYKEYLGICSRIKRKIRNDQIVWGMTGIYNPSITQRLNWLVEKQESKNENSWEIIFKIKE